MPLCRPYLWKRHTLSLDTEAGSQMSNYAKALLVVFIMAISPPRC